MWLKKTKTRKPQSQDTKAHAVKKPVPKGHMLYDSISEKCPAEAVPGDRAVTRGCREQVAGGGGRRTPRGRSELGMMKMS